MSFRKYSSAEEILNNAKYNVAMSGAYCFYLKLDKADTYIATHFDDLDEHIYNIFEFEHMPMEWATHEEIKKFNLEKNPATRDVQFYGKIRLEDLVSNIISHKLLGKDTYDCLNDNHSEDCWKKINDDNTELKCMSMNLCPFLKSLMAYSNLPEDRVLVFCLIY